MRLFSLLLMAAVAATAQVRPELNDGEAHGDAPYLIEDGWTPLLSGKDVSGWHGRANAQNEWFTTRGVRWERLLAPKQFFAIPEPAGTIVNGPAGRTVG